MIKLAEVAEVEIDHARLARCKVAKDRAGRIGAQVFEALAARFSYSVGTLGAAITTGNVRRRIPALNAAHYALSLLEDFCGSNRDASAHNQTAMEAYRQRILGLIRTRARPGVAGRESMKPGPPDEPPWQAAKPRAPATGPVVVKAENRTARQWQHRQERSSPKSGNSTLRRSPQRWSARLITRPQIRTCNCLRSPA